MLFNKDLLAIPFYYISNTHWSKKVLDNEWPIIEHSIGFQQKPTN